MSNPDEPKKKPPQATVAWNPEDLPDPLDAGLATGSDEDEPEEDRLVGQLLRDKWRVLERIGAGSFGTVYKVEDVKGGWVEALKILGVDRLHGSEAENARKRFLREAQIMKRLGTQSAHIVGLSTYEEDLEAGLIYFLMELVEGRDLATVVRDEGRFSTERTIKLALQVCDALMAAHEGPEPVVHRDLKLENIMLTTDRAGDEIVKVLDFGIAKLAGGEADSRLTTVGTLGTPGYAAPEQLRAEEVDGRTDLFAFGVVLYALLAGHDPWLGNAAGSSTHQIYELMVASDRGEVRPIDETGAVIPPAMTNIVLRLLRRDPDERFQTARELRDALLRVGAGGAEADAASLRVITDTPGVEIMIRLGRQAVAEGPTPHVANGLAPGTYKVSVRDRRYRAVETSVALGPGAMEDLTLVTELRSGGAGSGVRRPGLIAAAITTVLLAMGAFAVRPWGRTFELSDLRARVASGGVTDVRLTRRGIEGRFKVGFVPAPFRVPVDEGDLPGAVGELRSGGLSVDTSWEVARLIGLAASAQERTRYFGRDGDDVRGFAQRAAVLEPGNVKARSLLLKVAERMAWDAEAAQQDGSLEIAQELVRECLTLVPEHAGCTAARDRN
ncbi:MAG: serine/threonine-protein kinase [Longimicrobiales bacterium]